MSLPCGRHRSAAGKRPESFCTHPPNNCCPTTVKAGRVLMRNIGSMAVVSNGRNVGYLIVAEGLRCEAQQMPSRCTLSLKTASTETCRATFLPGQVLHQTRGGPKGQKSPPERHYFSARPLGLPQGSQVAGEASHLSAGSTAEGQSRGGCHTWLQRGRLASGSKHCARAIGFKVYFERAEGMS